MLNSLAAFKDGRVDVLVATDVAARGLDIAHLPLVVNYDLPLVPEDYVHRVGRTGRAGREGRAVSIVSTGDGRLLRDIEKLLPVPLAHVAVEGFEAVPLGGGGHGRGPQRRGNGGPGPRGAGHGGRPRFQHRKGASPRRHVAPAIA